MFELQTEQREIGGRKTSCKQFPVSIQARLATRLGRALSPGLPGLGALDQGANVIGALAPVIYELFAGLDDDAAWRLQLDLVRECTVDYLGQPLKLLSQEAIDTAFGADTLAFWQTVLFALEVNFGPLFERGKALLSAIAPAPVSKVAAPPPLTPAG